MTSRKQRRSVILSIYFVIFFGLLWMIISAVRPDPTCTDGKQNQHETGVDCGGECAPCAQEIVAAPLAAQSAFLLDGGHGTIDAVAQVVNSNTHFGSSEIAYTFTVRDQNGDVVAEKSGATFILPLETKYVTEINFATQPEGFDINRASVDFAITNTQWHQFVEYQEPQVVITNKQYGLTASSVNYSNASGLLHNDSPYDFNQVIVTVVLKNTQGDPIAIQRTELNTVDAGMVRGFNTPWMEQFPGEVASYDMEAEVNVFDSLNYRKKYIPGGQYQDLQ
jgi:hypothetical protein